MHRATVYLYLKNESHVGSIFHIEIESKVRENELFRSFFRIDEIFDREFEIRKLQILTDEQRFNLMGHNGKNRIGSKGNPRLEHLIFIGENVIQV